MQRKSSVDMQQNIAWQAAEKHHRHAEWTCSMYMQHGRASWTCDM
jgi:hypothetical protein